MSASGPRGFTTYGDGEVRCHCNEWLRGSDHCPHCGCEEYERDCGERRRWAIVGLGHCFAVHPTREIAELFLSDYQKDAPGSVGRAVADRLRVIELGYTTTN